jgi:hypothetical protein
MREIRAILPPEIADEAARLAHAEGIERVSIADVFVHGPNLRRKLVSVETSTPKARAFADSLLMSPVLSQVDYTLTSREVRSIVDNEPLDCLTRPMSEPFTDVLQDLWQMSHVTLSYISRAAAGAALLATGVIEDNAVAIVVAAMFLPFLSVVLAISFGLWNREWRLLRQGLRGIVVSTALGVAAGAVVALIEGGPIRFVGFKNPLSSFAISAVIGVTAGLSNADDTGRRYLIGVAAAVQLAIFPVWFGAAFILGLPGHVVLYSRLLSFGINLVTISASAVAADAALHFGAGAVGPLPGTTHTFSQTGRRERGGANERKP